MTLDARGSYSTRGDLVKYEWGLDGDEQYEIESTEPTLAHTWESEYVGDIHLRVTGPRGFTDTASTDVMITNDGDSTPYDQDNCPEVNNHGQTDYDGEGIGDECDTTPGYPQEDQPGVGEGPAPTPTPTPSSSPSATPHANDRSHTNADSQRECERNPHRTAQHRSKQQPRPHHGTDPHPHTVRLACTNRRPVPATTKRSGPHQRNANRNAHPDTDPDPTPSIEITPETGTPKDRKLTMPTVQ